LLSHVLFGKPASTFPAHALGGHKPFIEMAGTSPAMTAHHQSCEAS
jgi:hypothetical protein